MAEAALAGDMGAGETVEVAGLHAELFGPQDAPAVVLSAGLGGGGRYWLPQVEALARDHRVILYDHRGTGKSARSPLPRPYAATHMAQDMVALLDGLGIASAHIIGHAAGAVAGLAMALLAPERVASVVAVNGWAVADPHFRRCFAIRRTIYESAGLEAYLTAQPLFLYPAGWISAHLEELDAERAHHLAHFQDAATLYARMEALETFDIRAQLDAITCPVLVMVAQDDMLVPAAAGEALAQGLPGATLVRLPYGGHACNITQQPDFDAALLRFLQHIRS